jgi:tRNA U54 and U55 pseudouridine synthase Pus10
MKKIKKTKKNNKKKIQKPMLRTFSGKWLRELFGSSQDFNVRMLGSNVVEVIIPRLNDSVFEEGGAVRLIAHILVDSDGRVKICKVSKDDNGIHYRLSTSVV